MPGEGRHAVLARIRQQAFAARGFGGARGIVLVTAIVGAEQPKAEHAAGCARHNLEGNTPAHRMAGKHERLRRIVQHAFGHRIDRIGRPVGDRHGRDEIGQRFDLRLPEDPVAQHARKQQQRGFHRPEGSFFNFRRFFRISKSVFGVSSVAHGQANATNGLANQRQREIALLGRNYISPADLPPIVNRGNPVHK